MQTSFKKDWAGGLPPELLEKVARAVPAGDRLWFRLVCRSWAAAGAGAPPTAGEEPLPPGKVTRTRGPDAAASVARAEMVRSWTLDGPVREKFFECLCEYAASGGHLSVLEWARREGYPWNEWTCRLAAESGHLHVLRWARAQVPPCALDDMVCELAAWNGHLAVVKWARAQGCDWGGTCYGAARNGHLEVLDWAHAEGCPWSETVPETAAENGHLAVLQWAHAQGSPLSQRMLDAAAENGHLELLRWAREHYDPNADPLIT